MSSEPSASLRVPELVCPAGGLPALKAAVDHGADCVYVGFRDETNARAFAGLNFDDRGLADGIAYAHRRNRRVLIALNTYPGEARFARTCARLGLDRFERIHVVGRLFVRMRRNNAP